MSIRFSKMHGLGNDFVVIDATSEAVSLAPEQIQALADRHFGIGFDQLLLVETTQNDQADFRYRIFNADGGEVAQCGNGARCFARFVRDHKLTDKDTIVVETACGLLRLQIEQDGLVTVDMGVPHLHPADIPFIADAQAETYTLKVGDEFYEIGVVSMGNPHAVLRVKNVRLAPVGLLGPLIESHERFPERVNVGFMEIVNRKKIRLRVFERGAGETMACGSGACAAVVTGHQQGLLDDDVVVELPGGNLQVKWSGGQTSVMMTGPATHVFEGNVT